MASKCCRSDEAAFDHRACSTAGALNPVATFITAVATKHASTAGRSAPQSHTGTACLWLLHWTWGQKRKLKHINTAHIRAAVHFGSCVEGMEAVLSWQASPCTLAIRCSRPLVCTLHGQGLGPPQACTAELPLQPAAGREASDFSIGEKDPTRHGVVAHVCTAAGEALLRCTGFQNWF